jgi:hypothetical protein
LHATAEVESAGANDLDFHDLDFHDLDSDDEVALRRPRALSSPP